MFKGPIKAALLAGVTAALLASVASAQPSDVRQRADAAYKQGVDLVKSGKTEAALAKFEESRAVFPTARALFQVAKAEHLLGQHDLALLHYRQVLRDESLPVESRQQATAAIEDLKTKVGMISLDVPVGATVTVDGNPVVDPNALIEVAPGTHKVKVSLGDDQRVATATCEAGKAAIVRIRFDAPPEEPRTAPPKPPPPAPVHADPGFWTTAHVAGVGLASLAVVGLGLGTVFVLAREGKVSDQADLATDPRVCAEITSAGCRAFDDAGDSASALGKAAVIAFVAGTLAGVGAVIVFRSPTPRASGRTARIVVNGHGVILGGAF